MTACHLREQSESRDLRVFYRTGMNSYRLIQIAVAFASAATVEAQTQLSLREAVARALEAHPSVAAARAAVQAADERIETARAGRLPKLNYSESFQRSNNPVFVFSSLLTQHQFGLQNFQIGLLNRPDPLNNFQSTLAADQVIFDGKRTSSAIRGAEFDRAMNEEQKTGSDKRIIAAVAKAYYGALAADATLAVAEQALRSAEADLKRARDVRSAGMSTNADVLSIEVHLASVKEQRISRSYDVQLAHAALNEAMGVPLDTPASLTGTLTAAAHPASDLADFEQTALRERAETRQTGIAIDAAKARTDAARSAFLPEVGARAVLEADRQRFIDRGGANWLAAVTLRWNLFNGMEDRARRREAEYAVQQAEAQQRQVSSIVRLDVRRAWFDLQAANERIAVTQAAVRAADESLRIIKNRYEAGLTTVTELLRNEVALLESQNRQLQAIHDQRVALVALESAAGTLSADSAALQ